MVNVGKRKKKQPHGMVWGGYCIISYYDFQASSPDRPFLGFFLAQSRRLLNLDSYFREGSKRSQKNVQKRVD